MNEPARFKKTTLVKRWLIYLGLMTCLYNYLSPHRVRTESETLNIAIFWLVLFCLPVAFLMIGRACNTIVARALFIIPGALGTLMMCFVLLMLFAFYINLCNNDSRRESIVLTEWRDGNTVYRVESIKSVWITTRDVTVLYRDIAFFPGLTFRSYIKSFRDTLAAQITSLPEGRLRLSLPRESVVFDFDR